MYTVIGIVKWTSCKLNYNHSCIKLFQTKIILNSLLVKSVSASVKRVSAWTWPNSAARMAGLRPFKSTMFGLAPRSRRNEIIFSLFLHAAKWRPVSPFSGSRLTSKIQIQSSVYVSRNLYPILQASTLFGDCKSHWHISLQKHVSPRFLPLGTFRTEEHLWLSGRNSILMTQINVDIINPVVMGF